MFTLFCFCLFCYVLYRSFLAIYNYKGSNYALQLTQELYEKEFARPQKDEYRPAAQAQHLCEEDHRQMDEEEPFDDFPGRTFLKRFGIPLAALIGWMIFRFQN